MIRKVYEVDPMACPRCGGTMKVIAFLTDYAVGDRILGQLKLTFVAAKPPPPHLAYQGLPMAAGTPAQCRPLPFLYPRAERGPISRAATP